MSTSQSVNSSEYVDLASARLGGSILEVSDEFFAPAENMLQAGRGIFIADKYTENGKWMDGWESRRKRVAGHDYCVVRLGLRGKIRAVDIDTNHFLGNHPPHASLEACSTFEDVEKGQWKEVLPKSVLEAGSQNIFTIDDENAYRFIRLHIYPDGGVARLRVYGEVVPNLERYRDGTRLDLLAVENGGRVLFCNDMFFSSKDNLIFPGRGVNMADGWETKRRRTPGNDWVVAKCGHPGFVDRIEVDTHHFKGNYPDMCLIEGIYAPEASEEDLQNSEAWKPLFEKTKLYADRLHNFSVDEALKDFKVSHIRMQIFPDGGVSRLRAWGRLA